MGRRRKYYTEEQYKESDCEKAAKYYEKNKELVRRKNLEKYYQRKNKTAESGSLVV